MKPGLIEHDRLFKELITTFFFEFLELFLPEVAAFVDPASVEFLDKEVFTDITSGASREVDIVARVRFRGEETCFLIHIENQARAERDFARRMFLYYARLEEKFGLPVYPIALFSYERPRRLEPSRYHRDFPNKRVLEFSFDGIQLNRLTWRDFVRKPNPVASALMSRMQIAPAERPFVKLECLRLLVTLRLSPAKMRLISGFVDTYLKLGREEQVVFQQAIGETDPAQKEKVMEIVTSWMEEGLEKGLKQGREQGRQEGRQEEAILIILRQLRHNLGDVSEYTEARLRRMTPEQLEELGVALLGFRSLQDLDRWTESAQ